MGTAQITLTGFKERLPNLIAYFSLFYFFEVIYIMLLMLVFQGKTVAVITGLFLSILLAIHIISLFLKKARNRKIQLFIMDLHFAYALSYIINAFINDMIIIRADNFIVIVRIILVTFELPLIYLLTDEKIIKYYSL